MSRQTKSDWITPGNSPQTEGPQRESHASDHPRVHATGPGAAARAGGVASPPPDAGFSAPQQPQPAAHSVNLSYTPVPTGERLHVGKGLFRGIMGPIGSGKSVTCCWELFRLACAQKPFNGVRRSRWAVIRATYPELHSTTIKTWQDWFPNSICPLKLHDSPITGRMKFGLPDGTVLDMELVFVALEREEDTRKVLSMELTGVWFNEARELPWGIIRDAMGRIGRYPGKKEGGHTRKAAIADTNPPDDDHWWYRLAEEGKLADDHGEVTERDFQFFKQPPALIVTETGYAPNPVAENIANLSDGYGYYLDQLAGRDPQWVRVYIMGEYGTIADGRPVYGKAYSDNLHCSTVGLLPIKKWPLVVAMDFGRTPAVAFLQQTARGQVRVVEEIVTEDSDVREVARDMILPRLATKYKDCTVYVTGDPAGAQRSQNDAQSCYDILAQELGGRIVDCSPAETNDPVVRRDSVRKLLSRIADGVPAFLLSPECKTLRKGFLGGYKYKTIRVGGGQTRIAETPEKNMYSHVHEAVQYGCMYLLNGLQTSLSLQRRTNAAPVTAGDQQAGY